MHPQAFQSGNNCQLKMDSLPQMILCNLCTNDHTVGGAEGIEESPLKYQYAFEENATRKQKNELARPETKLEPLELIK
jgi:hypothetical protein